MDLFLFLMGLLALLGFLIVLGFYIVLLIMKKNPSHKLFGGGAIALFIAVPILLVSGLTYPTEDPDSNVAAETEQAEEERIAEEEQAAKEEEERLAAEKEAEEKAKQEAEEKKKAEEEAEAKKKAEEEAAAAEAAEKEKEEAEAASTNTAGTTDLIPVTLVRTVDGDTAVVNYDGQEHSVRYLLIDTPETKHPQLGKQPFGQEASDRNKQLINSGQLSIEFDVGERVDRYDRLLAYVYVDGVSVQETLVREGLARVAYVYPPNTRHLDSLKAAEDEAKAAGRGIWSVENYAQEDGFNSDAVETPAKDPVEETPAESAPPAQQSEIFDNCTHLKTVYPDGVPLGHPAYQGKMDRDKDDWACE